ncbi:hypothetical protein M7I_1563 [Glarea lozoyensis 74030]|uniref:Uncharacterized protein n=1 Tax=Glarea lozoyensis (strain ATCC 74030 / MF5533) TaxID=1104152 RepID=H0EGE7_GLAL7|nr:hypothetical protein M7I_1563 [Glarea lozoyensis 74030]
MHYSPSTPAVAFSIDFVDFVAFVVGWLAELGVCEERVHYSQVGVAEGDEFVGEVEEVADYYVEEDAEVIGVEVFVGDAGGEEEVEQLEDEELEARFGFPV